MKLANQKAPGSGLLGTVGATPKTPATDLTNPEAPALRMPDPGDAARREMLKGLLMTRLRGGRRSTIMSGALRSIMGTSRTASAGL